MGSILSNDGTESNSPAVSMAAREYVQQGWVLVPIPAGQKGPTAKGWNLRARCITSEVGAAAITGNVGLAHAYSRTAAIDIDDLAGAQEWLKTRQIDLHALLSAEDAVRISSGRAGRAKLLYRLPEGVEPLPSKKIAEGKTTLLELRCASASGATVQCVLPPSLHPDTGKPYVWEYGGLLGHWTQLPTLPQSLLALWQALIERNTSDDAADKAPLGMTEGQLRDCLGRIDADLDYAEWLKVLMAAHHESRGQTWGLELADAWSSTGSKYQGRDEIEQKWDSFGRERQSLITARHLLSLANVAGIDEFDDLAKPDETQRNVSMTLRHPGASI